MEDVDWTFQYTHSQWKACALLAIGGLGWSWKSMLKKSKEQADKKDAEPRDK